MHMYITEENIFFCINVYKIHWVLWNEKKKLIFFSIQGNRAEQTYQTLFNDKSVTVSGEKTHFSNFIRLIQENSLNPLLTYEVTVYNDDGKGV